MSVRLTTTGEAGGKPGDQQQRSLAGNLHPYQDIGDRVDPDNARFNLLASRDVDTDTKAPPLKDQVADFAAETIIPGSQGDPNQAAENASDQADQLVEDIENAPGNAADAAADATGNALLPEWFPSDPGVLKTIVVLVVGLIVLKPLLELAAGVAE